MLIPTHGELDPAARRSSERARRTPHDVVDGSNRKLLELLSIGRSVRIAAAAVPHVPLLTRSRACAVARAFAGSADLHASSYALRLRGVWGYRRWEPSGRLWLAVFATLCASTGAALGAIGSGVAMEQAPQAPAPDLFVTPTGSDTGTCSKAAPCATWNRAYQVAKPGDVVQIGGGEYGPQEIAARAVVRNLSPGCTSQTTQNCIVFRPAPGQQVIVNGWLAVRGSSVWVRGTATPPTGIPTRNRTFNITVRGFVNTEATSQALYPDHVILEGIDATNFGVFNARTVTLRNMDIGPATVGAGCRVVEGPGFENKIGFSGGYSVVPTDITLDRLLIHNQNRNSDGAASGCHFGGLFLVTVNGLTIKNSVFSQNAVYNIQAQNFVGPPPQNVRLENNWFGCPVEWLYETVKGGETACNGQVDIQLSAASLFSNWLIRYNSLAAGIGQYVAGASYENVRIVANATAGFSGCYAGMTFAYNASQGRTCSPTDKRLPGPVFVAATPGQENFQLRRGTGASALAPPTSADLKLALDMEGRVRPLRFPRDAGALQRDTALIVLGRSIGSASVGMKRAEILGLYGQPGRSRPVKLGTAKTPATVDRFAVPGGSLEVTTVSDRVIGLATTSPYYTTPRGLGPGSPRADADRLTGTAWMACDQAFRRPGPVVVSLLAGKKTVKAVVMVRRAYVTECPAKRG